MSIDSQPNARSPFWDARFAEPGFAYGEQANDFLRAQCPLPGSGTVLSLCEGEGRNAVYLARLGYRVTVVDFSAVGLAKASLLAQRHAVKLTTIVADLADFDLGTDCWDLVVSIFAQPPCAVRQRLYRGLHQALRPGGRLILETKAEAGATDASRYPGLAILGAEIAPLQISHAQEQERLLSEGRYHAKLQRTAQIAAFRPVS